MENYSDNLFLYLDGLESLVKESLGDEHIHIGIRPYGFHAGNALALVSYPYILCKTYLQYHGKAPKFNFFVSINDWEQDALDGPDYRKYPFNIYPKNTSLQYTTYRDKSGHISGVTDYWQPIIESAVRSKMREFNSITITFVRNSELKSNKVFHEFLMRTISDPESQAKIFKRYSGRELLDDPLGYAGAVCPSCRKTKGETKVIDAHNEVVSWECFNCLFSTRGVLEDFDYWWYHKPLLVVRLKIFDIDVTLSGGDHFSEGDFVIRNKLIEYFDPGIKIPKMLFTPILLSPIDNERMSKSKGNHVFADLDKLTDFTQTNRDGQFLLPQSLVMNTDDTGFKTYCSNR